jgi:hypothetical protein
VEPAESRDERVKVLVRALEAWRRRALSLDRLCVVLLTALVRWQGERQSPHHRVPGMLDDR